MIAALDDLSYKPPRLPLFEPSRVMSDGQRRAMWAKGWRSVLPTLDHMAAHFDRYDDILSAFAQQVGHGYSIAPAPSVFDHSLDSRPPVMLRRDARPYPAATVGDRRHARIAEKAAKLQAEYEAQQRAKQERREEVSRKQWQAEEVRRVAALRRENEERTVAKARLEAAEAERLARGQRIIEEYHRRQAEAAAALRQVEERRLRVVEVRIERVFDDPHMQNWFMMLAAHSGPEQARKWVEAYIEQTKSTAA